MHLSNSHQHIGKLVLRALIWCPIMLAALLVMLVGATGCQPSSNPETEADQNARLQPTGTALPASSEASSEASALPADTEPAPRSSEFPLHQYVKFGRLTTDDGLSNVQLWDVVQNNDGFMWFASSDGLNRYDGSDFKVYRYDSDDPNSLSQSFTRGLVVDRSGDLWIVKISGDLNRYVRETERNNDE